MALFNHLLNLHNGAKPEEDFFTELVVALARHDAELIPSWLETIGVTGASKKRANVRSQIRFSKLNEHEHESDSIVDMVVQLSGGTTPDDLVFVESKLASSEIPGQLQRYAQHLEREDVLGQRWLIFVTQQYEPKPEDYLKTTSVKFLQARWHEFYPLLKKRPPNPLTIETLNFMETHRLSQGNRFAPLDMLVLRNMKSTLDLTKALLDGKLGARMKQITASTSLESPNDKLLRQQGIWVLERKWPSTECALQAGIVQPDSEALDIYPLAAVTLWVGPKAPDRESIRSAMRASCGKDTSWTPRGIDSNSDWFAMRMASSLDKFVSAEDQVETIRVFLIDALNQAESWLNEHPSLRFRES